MNLSPWDYYLPSNATQVCHIRSALVQRLPCVLGSNTHSQASRLLLVVPVNGTAVMSLLSIPFRELFPVCDLYLSWSRSMCCGPMRQKRSA